MRKIILIILSSIFLPTIAMAHQPRIVPDEAINGIEIKNPEISQAFYGELIGSPHHFIINSEEPFRLYVGLLTPDIEGTISDFSAKIIHFNAAEEEIAFLNGENFEWKKFYEEFVGDWYFEGPEFPEIPEGERLFGEEVPEGYYRIKVFSPDDLGKYVLAVGFKEEFPKEEIRNTARLLPILKTDFFEKSIFSIFQGKIGMFLLIGLIIFIVLLSVIIFVGVRLIKKFMSKTI